jgi:esterase/lipase
MGVLSTSVGADGKQREMFCLPLEFVFGWLFTINPKNVSEEARPLVIRYKMECYRALYNYFTRYKKFVSHKDNEIEKANEDYQQAKTEFRTAKERMLKAEHHLNRVRKLTIEEWEKDDNQLKLDLE